MLKPKTEPFWVVMLIYEELTMPALLLQMSKQGMMEYCDKIVADYQTHSEDDSQDAGLFLGIESYEFPKPGDTFSNVLRLVVLNPKANAGLSAEASAPYTLTAYPAGYEDQQVLAN